ncbi:MAG: hypothetical protein ACKVP0_23460 [Pirellulaceae bacterium]
MPAAEVRYNQLFAEVGMTTDRDNPYSAPALIGDYTRVTRWHVVPAAASFVIGAASFGLGLGVFAVGMNMLVLSTQHANAAIDGMVAGCSLYLGFGAAWMVAGWCYGKRRFCRGLIATGFGVLIPVVLFAILGF